MVSVLAFVESSEECVKASLRARRQDRSYTLSAPRCSRLSAQAALGEATPQKCTPVGAS